MILCKIAIFSRRTLTIWATGTWKTAADTVMGNVQADTAALIPHAKTHIAPIMRG